MMRMRITYLGPFGVFEAVSEGWHDCPAESLETALLDGSNFLMKLPPSLGRSLGVWLRFCSAAPLWKTASMQ